MYRNHSKPLLDDKSRKIIHLDGLSERTLRATLKAFLDNYDDCTILIRKYGSSVVSIGDLKGGDHIE